MAQETTAIKISPGSRGRRDTRPSWRSISYASGYDSLGYIPRRGFNPDACRILEAAEGKGISMASLWGGGGMLRLLALLVGSSPIAGFALANDLGYSFGPETRIVALDKAGQKDENKEGTAAIEQLWRQLPAEIGGLRGLQSLIGTQKCLVGQNALEAVVGGPGVGLLTAVDFDPLSLIALPPPQDGKSSAGSFQALWKPTQWTQTGRALDAPPLDTVKIYMAASRGGTENPYGVPRYAEAFRDLLSELGEQQGLSDVLKAVAFPHIVSYFPLTAMAETGARAPELWTGTKDIDGEIITSPYLWAKDQYNRFNAALPSLLADDSILLPDTGSGKGIDVVAAGTGLSGVLDATARRALRIAQGLKHPPSMLGIDSGGTMAHFESDFKNHCALLELFRHEVNEALLWLARLHLRLLGMNLHVEARLEPIYTPDRLNAAKARSQEIRNELELAYSGVQDPETTSQILTETPLFDKDRFEEGRKRWLGASTATTTTDTTTTADNNNG